MRLAQERRIALEIEEKRHALAVERLQLEARLRVAQPRSPMDGSAQPDIQSPKNRGGRPPKFNWFDFDIEIMRLANSPDGLPSLTELRKYMLDWTSKWSEPPSETSVKDRTAKIYRKLGL
jgi:hypothetical protein